MKLRWRGPLETLDVAVALARSLGRPWWRLILVLTCPPALVFGLWVAWLPQSLLPWIALVLWLPLVQVPVLCFGASSMFGEAPGVRQTLVAAAEKGSTAVVLVGRDLLLLLSVPLTLGLATLPLWWVSVWWAEVWALERVEVGAMLSRGGRLVWGALPQSLVAAVLGVALPVAGALSAEVGLSMLWRYGFQLGVPFQWEDHALLTPWGVVGLVIAAPTLAWVRLLLYLDARVGSEGWDLQVEIERVIGEEGR